MARICIILCVSLFLLALVPPLFGYDLTRVSTRLNAERNLLRLGLPVMESDSPSPPAGHAELFAAQ